MHGTVPLLRSVTCAASHSPSKIPHIRCHIALRQNQARPPQIINRHAVSPQQQRYQSTIASPAYLEKTVVSSTTRNQDSEYDSSLPAIGNVELNKRPFASVETFSSVLDNVNMFDALQEGLPDRILSGLMSDAIGTPFIRQAQDELFNKALTALDPEYFIEPFKEVSRHLKGPRDSNPLQTKTVDDRMSTFAAYLDRIVALRREAGMRLDLEACNHLLKCAKSMGDGPLARSVLDVIMPADGVEPDLESYNYYCQAIVWSHGFSSIENYNLRVIPRHLEMRASRSPPKGLSGHATFSRIRGVRGIREEVLNVFKTTTDKAFPANELMFINVMLAMGREHDIDGVKSILKSVWNIDVDLLGAYDEEEIESPTFYDIGHHLRPSEDLLYAIAHIFGSNNEIRTAWLLVDFVSRNYDLRIKERVWFHLCEWAFVLSLRRSKAGREKNLADGQTVQQTFAQLFEVMADEPHNIQPSAFMHFLMSRSWRDRKHLDNTISHVEKLGAIVDRQHSTIKGLAMKVANYTKTSLSNHREDAFTAPYFLKLRRQYVLEFSEFQRSLQLMLIAVHRNLLKETNWAGSGKLTEWERRKLPTLVAAFEAYLPKEVEYRTKTGTVSLSTVRKRRGKIYQVHKIDYRILPRVLNAMDTEDQVRLNRRMEALPHVIHGAKAYCFNCESIGHSHDKCHSKPFSSSTLDYIEDGERKSDPAVDEAEILVLNPEIIREALPFAFEPGSEKEYSKPSLPFA